MADYEKAGCILRNLLEEDHCENDETDDALEAAAELCEAWPLVEELLSAVEQREPEVEASLTFADLKGDEGVVANLALDQLAAEVRRLRDAATRLRVAVAKP